MGQWGVEVDKPSCQTEIIEQSVAQQMYSTCIPRSPARKLPTIKFRHAFPQLP